MVFTGSLSPFQPVCTPVPNDFLSPAAHLPGIFLSFFATLFCPLPWWLCLQLIFLHSLSLLFSSAPVQLSCVQTSQLITSLPSQASTVQLKLSSIHLTHHPHYAFAICLPACSAHFALVFHILNASSPKTLSKLNALLMHNTKSMTGESNILFNFLFSQ